MHPIITTESRPEAMADVPGICELPLTRAVVHYRDAHELYRAGGRIQDIGLAVVVEGRFRVSVRAMDLGSAQVKYLNLASELVILDWVYDPTLAHIRDLAASGPDAAATAGSGPSGELRRYCFDLALRVLDRRGFFPPHAPLAACGSVFAISARTWTCTRAPWCASSREGAKSPGSTSTTTRTHSSSAPPVPRSGRRWNVQFGRSSRGCGSAPGLGRFGRVLGLSGSLRGARDLRRAMREPAGHAAGSQPPFRPLRTGEVRSSRACWPPLVSVPRWTGSLTGAAEGTGGSRGQESVRGAGHLWSGARAFHRDVGTLGLGAADADHGAERRKGLDHPPRPPRRNTRGAVLPVSRVPATPRRPARAPDSP